MRNLARLTNAANRLEAWKDWNKIALAALNEHGIPLETIKALKPPDKAGWKTIDKQIAELRNLIEKGQDHDDSN